jgi:hypothetical protein
MWITIFDLLLVSSLKGGEIKIKTPPFKEG